MEKEAEQEPEKGQTREEAEKMLRQAQFDAAVETIRLSKTTPYNETVQAVLSNTTAQNLDTPRLQPDRLYTITHVSAVNETRTGTRTELYYVLGEQEFAVNRGVQSAAAISVDFDGKIVLGEDARMRAKFVGGTAADVLKLTVSGFWTKA